MTGQIYLIKDDDTLEALAERPYENEALLQILLGNYPDLLAGEQIDEANPRRWLLVSREIGFPEADDGGQRMSLDHLFLDQDGVPTLVEVKRSSDHRIRREVVGQMLDYAANAVGFWSVEYLRSRFETAVEDEDQDPFDRLSEFLELDEPDEPQVEAFWQQVKTNLQARKIRLVFVADEVPPSLRRIVEFLNEQMDPAEVLAVELRQYVGEGIKTIVPRVIGQTAEAQQKKGRPPVEKRQWDEASFFADIEKEGETAVAIARQIFNWARKNNLEIYWGQGITRGSFVPVFVHNEVRYQLCSVLTNGLILFYLSILGKKRPFNREDMQEELVTKLNNINDVNLPSDAIRRKPKVEMSIFGDPNQLKQLLSVFEWVIEVIQQQDENAVVE